MNRNGLRIGRHYSPGGSNVLATIAEIYDEAASAIQIMAGNPHHYWASKSALDQADKFKELTSHLYKVVHAPYITNLCTPQDERGHRMTIHSLVNQLEWAEAMGCDSLVHHPGSPKDRDRKEALDDAYSASKEVLAIYTGPVKLLYENAAHPRKLGGDIPELAEFVKSLDDERAGICIDTTHAFAAGYDYDAIFQALIDLQNDDLLHAVHFNTPDPDVKCGSKHDRHSSGFSNGAFPLEYIQQLFVATRDLPLILEGTPNLHEDLTWFLTWQLEDETTGKITPPKPSANQLADDIFSLAVEA